MPSGCGESGSSGSSGRRGRTDRLLRQVAIIPISLAISQAAYHLVESFFLSHGLLIPDALIAATALEQGLLLYRKNTRHFQMIPALSISRPY